MQAVSRMRVRYAKVTRAPSSLAPASRTRSTPSLTKVADARSRPSTRDSIGRTASPSPTAHSTSPSSRKSRRLRRSRTTSTTRLSRWLSTMICPRTRRTAGNSLPSVPTTISISMSVHRAISACRRPPTHSFVASISTAAARKSWREEFGKSSGWTGTRC